MSLETERLVLRAARLDDFEAIYHLRSDEKINQYIKRSQIQTREIVQSFLERTILSVEKNELFDWVICSKENQKVIGSICLWNVSEDRSYAELGYALRTDFHGKGIMNEAVSAVLKYGFTQLFLDKIEAYTSRYNVKSIRMLERNGFQLLSNKRDDGNADNRIFELLRKV
ncbi:MAG: GNAT family N-acetyltransferase [Crocinitomicaceae bacterium]